MITVPDSATSCTNQIAWSKTHGKLTSYWVWPITDCPVYQELFTCINKNNKKVTFSLLDWFIPRTIGLSVGSTAMVRPPTHVKKARNANKVLRLQPLFITIVQFLSWPYSKRIYRSYENVVTCKLHTYTTFHWLASSAWLLLSVVSVKHASIYSFVLQEHFCRILCTI